MAVDEVIAMAVDEVIAMAEVKADTGAAWRAFVCHALNPWGNVPNGGQFGFSVAGGRVRGQVDGILAGGPAVQGMGYPALWECKTMNAGNYRKTVAKGVVAGKPVYAAQIALYQAYMEGTAPGISHNPALFTAINKDSAELHHELRPFDAALAQRMSDRAVRILQASDAGELLPRIARERDFLSAGCAPGPNAAGACRHERR